MCTCLIGCQVQTITKPMPSIGKKKENGILIVVWKRNILDSKRSQIQLLEVIDITDCDILLHTTSCLRFVLPYKAAPLCDVLSFEKKPRKK